jgi:hypothetical protein
MHGLLIGTDIQAAVLAVVNILPIIILVGLSMRDKPKLGVSH